MLYYHAFADNDHSFPDHDLFYNSLAGLGDLEHCEYVAISNGSQINEEQLIGVGRKMLDADLQNQELLTLVLPDVNTWEIYDGWEIDINDWLENALSSVGWHIATGILARIDVWALPDGSTKEKIYRGHVLTKVLGITVGLSLKQTKVKDMIPYDSAPGGANNLIIGQVAELDGFEVDNPSYCFTPIVSALDLKEPENNNIYYPVNDNNALTNSGRYSSRTVCCFF